jgi:tetratricopeptide (TPR) repeat protein
VTGELATVSHGHRVAGRSGLGLDILVEGARTNFEAGLPVQAEAFYRVILAQTTPPKTGAERVAHGEACVFFANKALAKNRLGEAGDWYREAIDADPRAADYRAEMAIKVLLPLGLLDAARIEAERATQIEPASVRTWRALGAVEHETGDAAASKAARGKALEMAPNDPWVLLDMAVIELDTANYDRVRELCGTVLEKHPARAGDAYHCLAMVAYREGRHEEAIGLYDLAIAKGCNDPAMARWNRALPLHSIGRYREGWADYEARGEQTTSTLFATAMRRFSLPLWRGPEEHPAPARIHLHEEMGWGDTIAMVRYAPLLVARGYDVTLEVREPLLDLFRDSFPGVTTVARAVDYPRALGIALFDYHAPLLSLPHALGITVEAVPWNGPYLVVDPRRTREWRNRLPPGLKIGICWSSGIRDGIWLAEYGRRKSMRLAQLAPLFSLPASFVSLQTGPEARENTCLPGLSKEPGSWADTAALIECLDLVVTVDTAVAHLAGAMGKPVSLMMHTEGSWHWMTGRSDSPWYPSAKIYRQKRPHQWCEVVERIVADLRG